MKCGACEGTGRVDGPDKPTSGRPRRRLDIPCQNCKGSGQDDRPKEWVETGTRMRADRQQRGLSLREEAIRRGIRIVVLSDMELGRIEPKEDTSVTNT